MKNNKGFVLFLVLATLLIVLIFANIILGLMANQTKLSHHQVARSQAIYASQGVISLVMEELRLGIKTFVPNDCAPTTGTLPDECIYRNTNNTFPDSVSSVSVSFCPKDTHPSTPLQYCPIDCPIDAQGGDFCIAAQANYSSD